GKRSPRRQVAPNFHDPSMESNQTARIGAFVWKRLDTPLSFCVRSRAISSVVERLLHTQEVAGSNPASRTIATSPSRAYCTLKNVRPDYASRVVSAANGGHVGAGRQ